MSSGATVAARINARQLAPAARSLDNWEGADDLSLSLRGASFEAMKALAELFPSACPLFRLRPLEQIA